MKGIGSISLLVFFGLHLFAVEQSPSRYEAALLPILGKPVSMIDGASLGLFIPARGSTPEVRIKGVPTSYVFTSCQVHILSDGSGKLVMAAIGSPTPFDDSVLAELEAMFRRLEAPEPIEVTRSEDNRRLLAYSKEGVLISAEKKEGEPGATDNPDDAQRLREDH